jgi:hypothetical protein
MDTTAAAAYKRAEIFRLIAGITAILAAVFSVGMSIYGIVLFISRVLPYIHMLPPIGYIRPLHTVSGIISALNPLAVFVPMILFAVFAFFFYGKKKNTLFKVSALLLAGSWLIAAVPNMLDVFGNLRYVSRFFAMYLIDRILGVLVCAAVAAVLIVMALTYRKKVSSIIKVLSVISVVLIFISTFFLVFMSIIIDSSYYLRIDNLVSLIATVIFRLLQVTPFLLFVFFCPPGHKRVEQGFVL